MDVEDPCDLDSSHPNTARHGNLGSKYGKGRIRRLYSFTPKSFCPANNDFIRNRRIPLLNDVENLSFGFHTTNELNSIRRSMVISYLKKVRYLITYSYL